MTDPALPFAAAALAATGMASAAALRAWSGWLDLKREQLASSMGSGGRAEGDVAALRARVRRLESIASGGDL